MINTVEVPRTDANEVECTIVKWLVAEGAEVAPGDPLYEIETDKAVVVVEAEAAGLLRKILVPAGDVAQVGQVVAYVGDADQQLPDAPPPRPLTPPPSQPASRIGVAETPPGGATGRVRASGAARKLAVELGVEIAVVAHDVGRPVRVEDVQAFAQAREEAVASVAVKREPLSRAQELLGQRLARAEALRVAGHLSAEIEVTPLLHRLRQESEAQGARLTLLDAVILACARALPAHPRCNATRAGTDLLVYQEVNVGVAMAHGDRLVVPVIRNADGLSLAEVALEKTRLRMALARGRLRPEDWQGGTFTVAELSRSHVDAHFPIINERQSAILGFGRLLPRCYPDDDRVRTGQGLHLTLSFDHMLMNGEHAAAYLEAVAREISAVAARAPVPRAESDRG